MSDIISISGDWLAYNNKVLGWVNYNPLNLPPYTIRLRYADGVTPTFNYGTAVHVSSIPNVWDLTYQSASWNSLLYNHVDLIEVLGANTSGVHSMWRTFQNCSNLESLALFDMQNVEGATYMFMACEKLVSIPDYNTYSLTNAISMFSKCSSLVTAPSIDTSHVIDMDTMFSGCFALENVPLYDMSSCRSTSSMFSACRALETVPLFDTSHVTNMNGMFDGTTSLKTVPLFDTHNVTNMGDMFSSTTSSYSYHCALEHIPLFDTSKVTNMSRMFYYAVDVIDGALALYQQAANQTNPPSNVTDCFSHCGENTPTGRAEVAQIPASWGGTMA